MLTLQDAAFMMSGLEGPEWTSNRFPCRMEERHSFLHCCRASAWVLNHHGKVPDGRCGFANEIKICHLVLSLEQMKVGQGPGVRTSSPVNMSRWQLCSSAEGPLGKSSHTLPPEGLLLFI